MELRVFSYSYASYTGLAVDEPREIGEKKMKYHGQELKEFASSTPVAFDPPKKMLCWDIDDGSELTDSHFKLVDTFLPAEYDCKHSRAVTVYKNSWCHCAEIPEGES